MIGCDICQRVCPYNALQERERQDTDEFTLAELLACAPDTMEPLCDVVRAQLCYPQPRDRAGLAGSRKQR